MPDVFVVPPLQHRCQPESAGPKKGSDPLGGKGSDPFFGPESLDVVDITNSLRSLMVRRMGVIRDRDGLLEAEQAVAFWCRYVLAREFPAQSGWELQNMLTIARLMIWSALQREESRGVHYRSDFPKRNDARWQHHFSCPEAM